MIECLTKGGKYGGYDLIHILMGAKTAQMLVESEFVLTRTVSLNPHPMASSSKRSEREWENSSDDDIVEAKTVSRNVSRKY